MIWLACHWETQGGGDDDMLAPQQTKQETSALPNLPFSLTLYLSLPPSHPSFHPSIPDSGSGES